MTGFVRLISRYRGKPLLIALAFALLVLNLGRWGINHYQGQTEALASKKALFVRYRNTAEQLGALRQKVERLEREKRQAEQFFLVGESEEEITSKLQVLLQEMVVKAELEPEYIKPVKQASEDKSSPFQEVAIKMRLGGKINALISLLAELRNSQAFFQIESFSLRPGKKGELRIFLDLKGFFVKPGPAQAENQEPKTAEP